MDLAIASWYYPNPLKGQSNDGEAALDAANVSSVAASAAEATATVTAAMLRMAMR